MAWGGQNQLFWGSQHCRGQLDRVSKKWPNSGIKLRHTAVRRVGVCALLIPAVLLAGLLLANAPPASAGGADSAGPLPRGIITQSGFGAVKLGMPKAEVIRLWGRPTRIEESSLRTLYQWGSRRRWTEVSIGIAGPYVGPYVGKVTRIGTNTRRFRTREGIGVGSTVGLMMRRYPSLECYADDFGTPRQYSCMTPPDPGPYLSLRATDYAPFGRILEISLVAYVGA